MINVDGRGGERRQSNGLDHKKWLLCVSDGVAV